eukprot:scaffold46298_cov62-Phaeocystis_antarctica.AAC.2
MRRSTAHRNATDVGSLRANLRCQHGALKRLLWADFLWAPRAWGVANGGRRWLMLHVRLLDTRGAV